MSQANQLSIATLFGGSTDQTALLGPPKQQNIPKCAASALHAYQLVAPAPKVIDDSSKKADDTPDPASHCQGKPLFQNCERYHPTETELNTAEEVQYEDLAQMFHKDNPPETPPSPTLSPFSTDSDDETQSLVKYTHSSWLHPLAWPNNRTSDSSTHDQPVHSVVTRKTSAIVTPEHLGYESFEDFMEDDTWETERNDDRGEHEDDGEASAPFNILERNGAE
ncbi:MAG: hypothetical protein Q9209_006567 [Squamulea sp. 1 TL-2023]